MNKLTIAFDAKRLFHNYTGLGNYSRTLVKNMVKFCPENQYHLFSKTAVQNEETSFFFEQKNVFIHTAPKGINLAWRTLGMSKEINSLNPDIFHGLSHEVPFGLNKNIVKLVSFHDLIWEIYPKQFSRTDRFFYRMKYRSSARRSSGIIAVSKSTARDLSNIYGIPPDKISIVYQACGDYFRTNTFSNYREHFLYVGSIIPRKGLDRIIEALSQMDDGTKRKLLIVGQGSGAYFQMCQNLVKDLGLQNWVSWLGKVPNSELMRLYDKAIALVFPSIYEGFGIPVIEALHRACPVITSTVSSLPEAGRILTTLVEPTDIAQIKTAMINHVLLPPPQPEVESIHQALSIFDGKETAHALIEVYNKYTSQQSRR